MIRTGILFALLSGMCNGLFTAPMKLESRWKWENIWFVFILTSCWAMPSITVATTVPGYRAIFSESPAATLASASIFGFGWGFGAICFGRSVHHLGVSVANSLVLGISSALGSLVPLFMMHPTVSPLSVSVLFAGVLAFIIGVVFCGNAARLRDNSSDEMRATSNSISGYIFAGIAGVMSAVFNIGYTLAQPIANTGVSLGYSRESATNCIWLLMLGAGAIPNIVYCASLMMRNRTAHLLTTSDSGVATRSGSPQITGNWLKSERLRASWLRSIAMGLLWGGSILLYGAATPKLGNLGPSVGWPLSLATGLLVANLAGIFLGEWRGVTMLARRRMYQGISVLLAAIILCAAASKLTS
ncbi:MAG: hypothetical protein JOZ62_22810 [Acidobacteriaceae bacterium]|nr:hypothetical protein [Acidobacteriaceae bacterium]